MFFIRPSINRVAVGFVLALDGIVYLASGNYNKLVFTVSNLSVPISAVSVRLYPQNIICEYSNFAPCSPIHAAIGCVKPLICR